MDAENQTIREAEVGVILGNVMGELVWGTGQIFGIFKIDIRKIFTS